MSQHETPLSKFTFGTQIMLQVSTPLSGLRLFYMKNSLLKLKSEAAKRDFSLCSLHMSTRWRYHIFPRNGSRTLTHIYSISQSSASWNVSSPDRFWSQNYILLQSLWDNNFTEWPFTRFTSTIILFFFSSFAQRAADKCFGFFPPRKTFSWKPKAGLQVFHSFPIALFTHKAVVYDYDFTGANCDYSRLDGYLTFTPKRKFNKTRLSSFFNW